MLITVIKNSPFPPYLTLMYVSYRDTAAALLKHNWPGQEWMKAMNCRVQKQDTKMFVDPLIMLIKEMPGIVG